VYSKKLSLSRGTDNVILFEFLNQDQKPVNISGSTLTFRLISQDGNTVLLTQDMVALNAAQGLAKITISEQQLDTIDAQPANYSVERTSGVLSEPVYVDDDASARGYCDIVDSVYPDFVSSNTITVPAQAGNAPVYTSTFQTETDMLTLSIRPSNFTGNIQVQGATNDTDDLWYNINDAVSFVDSNTTVGLNVVGYHPYVRLAINTDSGNISEILYR